MVQRSKPGRRNARTEWILGNLTGSTDKNIKISGKPGIVKCKYGEAVSFDGSGDAIFLESNPLADLEQFTVEIIFQPSAGGNFEQRFLHCGDVQGDRVLLELRATQAEWYFDAFIKVGDQQCALIDPALLHPLDKWYHLAYVVNNGKLETYVNGKKELEGQISLTPVTGEKTSIGARQNGVSWFKGAIYKILITGSALQPGNFLTY
jgi:hypothetical protein